MATTIGDTVSRVRNIIKGVREDAFITDRFLYSMVLKQAKMLIRRQDNEGKIKRIQNLFETIPCIELIEVSKIDACCSGIVTDCKIMRSKDKLPNIMSGSMGPLFRSVSSIDRSIFINPTYPNVYINMTKSTSFKYNTNKYYWYSNGYLYFPNIEWESVSVEALWEDSINYLKCESDECSPRQDDNTPIPDYLFGEIEQLVLREIMMLLQTPQDNADDKQNILRS